MRRTMAVLMATGVGLCFASAALAQTGSLRDGKDSGVSFRLASDRPARGFEATEIGGDRTMYVATEAVMSGSDVSAAETSEARSGVDMKLSVSGDALNRLRTQMRTTGATSIAVVADSKVIAAGEVKIDGDRVSINGLTSTQATRLTRVLNRVGTVTPGAVVSLIPSAASIAPGGTITVDAFASAANDLRSYQVTLAVSGGNSGTITVSDLNIDGTRADYVFANQAQKFDAVDPVGGRLGGVIVAGGVNVANPAYLGTFTLQASSDASGAFNVKLEQAGQASLLWTSQNTPIEFSSATLAINAGGKPGSIRSRD